ncbi:Uu.00g126020.m01.CDS01 [Anthostomella pinea]|uniref:Uu.00g126020.m01.CDS01 n=1 Tax=Anthostomella pinea TaxID=933095 RepID=A0AAI8VHX3_9PEZI|nr:Uu.00g126020.m01.CDS01 [Anthostomella pinea]
MLEHIELNITGEPPTEPPKPAGYAQWASWMAADPDNEPFIFRKFDELAAVDLLYLQSEMIDIEAELKEMNQEATPRPPDGIRRGHEDVGNPDEALLLQSEVAKLQTPSRRALSAVKQAFRPDGYPIIEGKTSGYLSGEDLVALKSPTKDTLSNY